MLRIFQFTSINSIHLEIEWIPRSENSRADYLSKIVEVDDWGIASYVLNMIESKWGKIDIDYFVSEHNAKSPIFYCRFWCHGTSGVDAFTFNWNGNFCLYVPLITLVPRVISKLRFCNARGVLDCPEWKSAYFWPFLCNSDGDFKGLIKEWMFYLRPGPHILHAKMVKVYLVKNI